MLQITPHLNLPLSEIEFSAIRAQGAGGQKVNKTSSAMHLRFDILASSLPEGCKQRLLKISDQRTTKDGVIVIKAQEHRTQDQNRAAALDRLRALIHRAATPPHVRKATKPSRSAKRKRMDSKTLRGKLKSLRGKISEL
jgi:ribosome-associated protein